MIMNRFALIAIWSLHCTTRIYLSVVFSIYLWTCVFFPSLLLSLSLPSAEETWSFFVNSWIRRSAFFAPSFNARNLAMFICFFFFLPIKYRYMRCDNWMLKNFRICVQIRANVCISSWCANYTVCALIMEGVGGHLKF